VLHGVPVPIARHTHARVATFLAREHSAPARIAEHWLLAARPLDALPWLKAAAEAARQAGRGKEQCEFLLRAAEVEELHGSRDAAFEMALQIAQSELHSVIADPLRIALTLERLAGNDRQRAVALGEHALLEGRRWHLADATALARQSMDCAEKVGDVLLINDARHRLASFAAMAGRPHEAMPWFEQIDESMAVAGTPAPENFHSNYALALDNMGRARQAFQWWQRALEIERSLGPIQPIIFSNLAINRQMSGHTEQAREHALESLRAHVREETALAVRAQPLLILARCEQCLGRWQSALAHLDGIGDDERPDYRQMAWSAQLRRGEIWLDLGQFARAVRSLAEVNAESGAHFKLSVAALCELARARRWQGQPLGDCLDRARELLPPDAHADLHLRMLLERGHVAPAETVAESTDRIISEAQALGLDGLVMSAWSLRAARLRSVAPTLAVAAAEHALEMSLSVESSGLYKPELWWHVALALKAAGQTERAAACVRTASTWVQERVRQGDVPPEFVDSFLHRNPVNRALLTGV
jgi:tetratricopeptide (TPR) repeat protein